MIGAMIQKATKKPPKMLSCAHQGTMSGEATKAIWLQSNENKPIPSPDATPNSWLTTTLSAGDARLSSMPSPAARTKETKKLTRRNPADPGEGGEGDKEEAYISDSEPSTESTGGGNGRVGERETYRAARTSRTRQKRHK